VRIEEMQHGQRLDNFLLRVLKGVPRSRVYRLIRRGEVRVNKKRSKPEQRLERGDQVRIPPYAGPEQSQPGKPGEGLQELLFASVMHEDEAVLILNKPAGLAVHGGSGIRLGLIEALRQMRPDWRHLELAHRLDRDTSGCLVIAKNPIQLKPIQEQFKARDVEKHYLALVHGQWPEALAEITVPLQRNELSGGERVVKVDPAGKPARTLFRVRQRFADATLLEVTPETGRTHQIRVHCQHAGHPIVGDARYVHSRHLGSNGHLNQTRTLCLHAWKIRFRHPADGAALSAAAPLDRHFQQILDSLQ
ncbi:MAG: RluA family pseudouridine synthase, partial [Pseudohongiellaceae bacterium]